MHAYSTFLRYSSRSRRSIRQWRRAGNYPVRLFDRAQYFAGRIALDTPPPKKAYAEAKREKIENFFDYGWTLFQTFMRSQVNRQKESGDWNRTV